MEQAPKPSGQTATLQGFFGILGALGTFALARLASDQGWLCGT